MVNFVDLTSEADTFRQIMYKFQDDNKLTAEEMHHLLNHMLEENYNSFNDDEGE